MKMEHSPYSEALVTYYDDEYEAAGHLRMLSDEYYIAAANAFGPGGNVLEFCCGTGRLAIRLARLGFAITAVDIAPAMLQRFRARLDAETDRSVAQKIQLIEADVGCLDLPQKNYDMVFCCFHSLNLMATKALQAQALSKACEHLRPGGVLAFDIPNPYLRTPFGGTLGNSLPLTTSRGTYLQRFDQCSPFDDNHCQRVTGWYDETDLNGNVKRTPCSWVWRILDKFEVEHMLRDAGFSHVEFSDAAVTDRSHFIVARR